MNVPAVTNSGQLIVGSMPIGNYDDITIRMVNAMRDCDIVFSDNLPTPIENLLDLYDVKKEIVVLNSTNTQYADQSQVDQMVKLILDGKKVLLVASEGQIGVADPGNQFIQACIYNSLPYTVLPGPSAFMNAFVASGITDGDFMISCNMEHPGPVLLRHKNVSNPLVILVWEKYLDDALEIINENYIYEKATRQITLACDMTMPTEMFITDYPNKIRSREELKQITRSTKIALVIGNLISL